MRCCYSVTRPPAKFHRIRSPFDVPTNKYSGNSSRSNVGRFRSPEIVVSSLISARDLLHSPPSPSSFPSSLPELSDAIARSETLSAQCIEPLTRAPESCPGPDSDSRYRCVRIIPKHLQNISVFLIGLPNLFFSQLSDFDRVIQIFLLSLFIVQPHLI